MDKMYINVFSIKKNKLIIKENKFNNKLYKLNFISWDRNKYANNKCYIRIV